MLNNQGNRLQNRTDRTVCFERTARNRTVRTKYLKIAEELRTFVDSNHGVNLDLEGITV